MFDDPDLHRHDVQLLTGLFAKLGQVAKSLGERETAWKASSLVDNAGGKNGAPGKNPNSTSGIKDAEAGMPYANSVGGAKVTTSAPNTPRFIVESAGNTIDLDFTKGLRGTNVTVTGRRGGVQYPLQGKTPNSYANLGNGHVVVYGPEGRALYDVSSSRIKVVEWNVAPNGTYSPKKGSDTKAFEGNAP